MKPVNVVVGKVMFSGKMLACLKTTFPTTFFMHVALNQLDVLKIHEQTFAKCSGQLNQRFLAFYMVNIKSFYD